MNVAGRDSSTYEHIFEPAVLDADPRAPVFNEFWSDVQVGLTPPQWEKETIHYEHAAPWGLPKDETFSVNRGSKPIMERQRMPDPITSRPLCGQHFHGRRDAADSRRSVSITSRRTCMKCVRIFAETYGVG